MGTRARRELRGVLAPTPALVVASDAEQVLAALLGACARTLRGCAGPLRGRPENPPPAPGRQKQKADRPAPARGRAAGRCRHVTAHHPG